jgi:glycosyltransferase involved in cell wall biosynthesis
MTVREISLRTYYALRPSIPQSLRFASRRIIARRFRQLHSSSWPINPISSHQPDWWCGWPEGKKFAFVLTHDVEGEKGRERCRSLADLEMSLGFRSSFNFVPERGYETPKSLRAFLKNHGFEIGVHDLRHDGRLFRSQRSFRHSARQINRYLADWEAVGFRSGFMLHNLDWVRDLHIEYDASTFDCDPFEPQPDGTNTIFPFWVGREDGSGYVELPYTLPQDSTLFVILREKTIENWTRKLDWVAQYGGLALVIVHPDYLNFDGKCRSGEYDARLYRGLLEYVSERYGQEAWLALPKQIATHVRSMRQNLAAEPDSERTLPSENFQVVSTDSAPNQSATHHQAMARPDSVVREEWQLQGKRVGMVMHSHYPKDPRPRRAAEALVRAGAQVDLICLTLGKQDPKHEVVNGINIFRIPVVHSRGSRLSYAFEYSAFLMAATAVLGWRSLVNGYDLVYVHNMPDILVLSALFPRLLGAKVILDLHDPMPELMTTIFGVAPNGFGVRLLRKLEKLSIRLADSVITVNLACAKLFGSRSCPREKLHVVMNSPDEGIFPLHPPDVREQSADAENDRFVIMYHGSIVERNGLALAIEALALLRESVPKAELRIYGWSTPFLEKVMSSVEERGLGQAVRYMGSQPAEQIAASIRECDVGIIPNLRNRFTEINTPTRIFEYLRMGKPVIAPRAEGITDYFDDSSLILFELGDARDLARKISQVCFYPARAREIVEHGQQVLAAHTWRQEGRGLIHLVLKLLGPEPEAVIDENRISGGVGSTRTRHHAGPPRVAAFLPAESRLCDPKAQDLGE